MTESVGLSFCGLTAESSVFISDTANAAQRKKSILHKYNKKLYFIERFDSRIALFSFA